MIVWFQGGLNNIYYYYMTIATFLLGFQLLIHVFHNEPKFFTCASAFTLNLILIPVKRNMVDINYAASRLVSSLCTQTCLGKEFICHKMSSHYFTLVFFGQAMLLCSSDVCLFLCYISEDNGSANRKKDDRDSTFHLFIRKI